MSTYPTNTYHTIAYPSMPSSLDPPQEGQNEYSQESQDSTRAQFDSSEDRYGVFSQNMAPTPAQNVNQGQIDPPGGKQSDFSQRRAEPPKPPSPPPPEPTPP